MKMKSEKERETWQKYAQNRYGEPLSVLIRRLLEEDMRDAIPREHEKIEELFNIIREENSQNFRNLLNRITIINEYLSSSTYEVSIELEVMKGLVIRRIDDFFNENKIEPNEKLDILKNDILKIFDEGKGINF